MAMLFQPLFDYYESRLISVINVGGEGGVA